VHLQRGTVSKQDLVSALSEVTTLPYIDCTVVQVSADILKTIPADMARRCDVPPIKRQQGKLTVVTAEPQNLQLIDQLRFKTGKEIIPQLGFHGEVCEAVARQYGQEEAPPVNGVSVTRVPEDLEGIEFISSREQQRNMEAMREIQAELLQKSKTTPAVQVVASTIKTAIQRSASDIHIEPQASETTIRLRVDGILRDFLRIPKALRNPVASRVKILSDMDISERRAPQDGRFL